MQAANTLGFFLQHIATLLARQSDQVLYEQLGIGMSQFRILRTLQVNPHIQQRQIADLLGQTEASISRQTKLLQERGMLATRINPENRREHLATLSMRGEKVLEAAIEVLGKYHAPTFNSLSPKEFAELDKSLSKLHDRICNLDSKEYLTHPGIDQLV